MESSGRIDPQAWMTAPETVAVLEALGAGGAVARFVGGCVRDAILGWPVTDIDIATPEIPDAVIALLDNAGIRAVPTGIAHGTVTAVVAGAHFEVTTLRRDVETFGRHARVAFIDDWVVDAQRLVQQRKQVLNEVLNQAMGEVQKALNDVITELAKEHNFTLFFRKDQTILVTRELEITHIVLERLNLKLPDVKVRDPLAKAPQSEK